MKAAPSHSKWISIPALLIAWFLGLRQLSHFSFWYDEFFNADLVLGHTPGEFLHILQTQQPYPPLYYLLLKGWSALAGVKAYAPGLEPSNGIEFLLRFPSVVAAVLALAALTALARSLKLRSAPWLPLLLALHPTLIWYARDARLYTFWIFAVLLALVGLLRRRRGLWVTAGAAALLIHYFALFPLAAAAAWHWISGFFLKNQRRPALSWFWLGLPFIPAGLWGLIAFRVAAGFESFTTTTAPTFQTFLEELGPDLLIARPILAPLNAVPPPALGYALMLAGALGLLIAALQDRDRAGMLAAAGFGGALATFLLWQLRPVHQARYLIWTLPLILLGLALLLEWTLRFWPRLITPFVAAATLIMALWSPPLLNDIFTGETTRWYPDFRNAVAFMNTHSTPRDRGWTVAAHGIQLFTSYRSTVPFTAGPAIGERTRPETVYAQLDSHRPEGDGRWWLLLYQDAAVDPGQLFQGTLEAAGGYQTEVVYSNEIRLFAYTIPHPERLEALAPIKSLNIPFQNGLILRGYKLLPSQGKYRISLYLFWELSRSQPQELSTAVHFTLENGTQPTTQNDHPLLSDYWPLSRLPVGESLPAYYDLIVPENAPFGNYTLSTVLYDPTTYQRVPLAAGGDTVILEVIPYPQ